MRTIFCPLLITLALLAQQAIHPSLDKPTDNFAATLAAQNPRPTPEPTPNIDDNKVGGSPNIDDNRVGGVPLYRMRSRRLIERRVPQFGAEAGDRGKSLRI